MSHAAPEPRLHAPEWLDSLQSLSEAELRAAERQLTRELEAPQTRRARECKLAALSRVRARLGLEAAPLTLSVPPVESTPIRKERMPMMTLREIRNEPIPERALDAFLAKLDGWNLDWSDPAEIENLGVPHYTPGDALQILLRAWMEGWLAQARPVEPAEPLEQLKLPLRAA